ncbi:MAG: BadF/BadG/BcrA/BcrD ATPase family protein, partial [Pseudomonadota bacterium]
AWQSIRAAFDESLAKASLAAGILETAIVAGGLAGSRNPERRSAFFAAAPKLGDLQVYSDGYAALIGAHGGRPGVVVAIGTGTVAHTLNADNTSRQVGGWGFPVGDEGGGAWLGWRAVAETLHVVDGRRTHPPGGSPLHQDLIEALGPDHETLVTWTVAANTTRYASLAPTVVDHASRGDEGAHALLVEGAQQIESLIRAADPTEQLPLALTGSLAPIYEKMIARAMASRLVTPLGSAVDGAILLARGQAPNEVLVA